MDADVAINAMMWQNGGMSGTRLDSYYREKVNSHFELLVSMGLRP